MNTEYLCIFNGTYNKRDTLVATENKADKGYTKLVLQWLRGEEYDVDKKQKEIAEQIAQEEKA